MQPLNDSFSMSSFADLCGRSGLGDGPGGRGCNLFKPGTLTGTVPQYVQYDSGNPGYDTDWNNFAPNVGVAWRPNVQGGWLRTLLGDPEQATIRAGYSLAFMRERMDRFTGLYSANPGAAINANRTGNQGNLVLPGESWPILLSQIGPPRAAGLPRQPGVSADAVARQRRRHQHLRSGDPACPYTKSWSVGFQRSLSDDMAVDIRYVGTRLANGWTTENWNEINVFENGFLDEFKAGAGQPARPRRRRLRRRQQPLLVRVSRRPAPARRRCRPISPTSARVPAARAGDPAVLHGARSSATARGPATSASTARIRSTPATTCTPTPRCAPTRSPPGCRPTSSSSTRTSTRPTSPRDAAQHEVRRAADRLPPPPLARPHGVGQLHLRQDATRPISTPSAATAPSSSTTTACRTRSRRRGTTRCRSAAASASAATSTRG